MESKFLFLWLQRATETEDTAGDEGAEGREARGYPGEEEEEEEEVVLQEYHSEDESCPEPRSVILAMCILNYIISLYLYLILFIFIYI